MSTTRLRLIIRPVRIAGGTEMRLELIQDHRTVLWIGLRNIGRQGAGLQWSGSLFIWSESLKHGNSFAHLSAFEARRQVERLLAPLDFLAASELQQAMAVAA